MWGTPRLRAALEVGLEDLLMGDARLEEGDPTESVAGEVAAAIGGDDGDSRAAVGGVTSFTIPPIGIVVLVL